MIGNVFITFKKNKKLVKFILTKTLPFVGQHWASHGNQEKDSNQS